MKPTLRSTLALLAPALFAAGLQATEPAWLKDLAEAKKVAAAENKPILLYFTGSTWCPPCKLVHAEVLPSPAFEAFAKGHVLVMLDYPPFSERSEEKVKANAALGKLMEIKDRYKVKGFPTMLVLTPSGEERARRVGYDKSAGPAAYLAGLK